MRGEESTFSNSAMLILCKEVRSASCDLSVIHLENVGLIDDDAALLAGALLHNTSVRSLSFKGNEVTSNGAGALARSLANHPGIIRVNAEANNLGVQGAIAMSSYVLMKQQVSSMRLGYNMIGDDGARAVVAAILSRKGVRDEAHVFPCLRLGGNGISPNAVKAVVALCRRNETITSLDLSNNRLGDEGALMVAHLLRQ